MECRNICVLSVFQCLVELYFPKLVLPALSMPLTRRKKVALTKCYTTALTGFAIDGRQRSRVKRLKTVVPSLYTELKWCVLAFFQFQVSGELENGGPRVSN